MRFLLLMFIFPQAFVIMMGETQSKIDYVHEGHHMCAKVISVDEKTVVPRSKLEKYEVKSWCLAIPPICTTQKYRQVTKNETVVLTKTKIAFDCCDGYEKKDKSCVPVCTDGCGNGECVHPNVCLCEEGWTGLICEEECEIDKYGQDCKENCTCENDGWCENTNGICFCREGYMGTHCEIECPEGTYGINCNYKCQCQNEALCDAKDGYCDCQPGYHGDYCEHKCEPGFHGLGCENICMCIKATTKTCDHKDGTCVCNPGFTGQYCEDICVNMTFGAECANHCDCEHAQFCEPSDGQCLCDIGWVGDKCSEKCTEGYFGDGCVNVCLPCVHDKEVCNHITGHCDCPPGYYGASCEKACSKDYWGTNCTKLCNCSRNAKCDVITGDCVCEDGWTGKNCSQPCRNGTYGLGCSLNCNCTNIELCNPVNGICAKLESLNSTSQVVSLCFVFGSMFVFLLSYLCVHFLVPKLQRNGRRSPGQDLTNSNENFGVQFQNPMYGTHGALETENPATERSISFVDISSTARASMTETRRSMSCQSGLETDFVPEDVNDFNTAENIIGGPVGKDFNSNDTRN